MCLSMSLLPAWQDYEIAMHQAVLEKEIGK
jgi:hypothetical protein